MLSSEQSYTEAEANEILRTAVRVSAADKLSIEDLVKAAGEIGIDRKDVERAESDFNRLRTEEGARKEFRRLQTNQFKIWILAGLFYLLINVLPGVGQPDLPYLIRAFSGLVGAVWIYAAYCLLWPDSPPYTKRFDEWRVIDRNYLTPEIAHQIVLGVVLEAIENHLTRNNAELILVMKVGYDRTRVKEVLDWFLVEHPEYAEGLA